MTDRQLMPGAYVLLVNSESVNEVMGVTDDRPDKIVHALEFYDHIHINDDFRAALLRGDVKEITIKAVTEDGQDVTVVARTVTDPEEIHRLLDEQDDWYEKRIEETVGEIGRLFQQDDGMTLN